MRVDQSLILTVGSGLTMMSSPRLIARSSSDWSDELLLRPSDLDDRMFIGQFQIIKHRTRGELMGDPASHIPLRMDDDIGADLLKHACMVVVLGLYAYLLDTKVLEQQCRQYARLDVVADRHDDIVEVAEAEILQHRFVSRIADDCVPGAPGRRIAK